MKSSHWLGRALRGEVSGRAGFWSVALTIVLTVVTAYLNTQYPVLRLSVLAFAYVIVLDGVLGLLWGVVGALATALIFSLGEWFTSSYSLHALAIPNFFSRLAGFLIVVALVEVIRRQSQALADKGLQARFSQLAGELAETDARFQAVSESIPFGVWHCNLEGRVIYMSPSFLNMLGMTLADVRAGGWFDRVLPEDADRIREAWRDRDNWGDVWEDEYRITGADAKVYTILCRGSAVRNEAGERIGWTGVNLDLTERSKAREQLHFLVDAGRTLSLSLDPTAVLERIAHLVVPRMADWCAIEVVGSEGQLQSTVIQHRNPEKIEIVRELRGYETSGERGSVRVVRTGKSELYETITDEMLEAAGGDQGERYLALLRQLGMRSAMIVPLQAREKILGTVTFVQSESDRSFQSDDVRFAEMLAARTALAFDNARSYAREQRVADTFQRASLPTSLPRIPGIRLRATYLSGANESEVGGDWYDAFLLPNGELGISIGDVAGKGLRAAVSMVSARQALRGAALEGLSPGLVLNRVNQRLAYEGGGMVTALFGIVDPITLRFRFASAGHPPPLLAHDDGSVERLAARGLPLGLFGDQQYEESTSALQPGSMLVLYTDGLIEFDRNVIEGERILHRAVASELASQSPNSADAIARRVILDAPKDDVAILTASIAPDPMEALDLVVTANPSSARVIRQALRRFALGVGLDETQTTELLVSCGEAISNVIEHAYGIKDGPVIVRAVRENDGIAVSVIDHGSWRPPREDGGGRGLLLMRALADRVEVEPNEKGTTVRLYTSLPSSLHDRSSNLSARSG
ncbi:MAG TPA: SpoIIE family protein phosphatase [Candidatus Acidoferrales bacterium]|nr:SpoIIE family protein phosphatase [Candidatus Acidoferrales bacterium]